MLNILQSMCEGMDDNIEAEAGPEQAGYDEESMDDDEASHEQLNTEQDEQPVDEKDPTEEIRDSVKIRKLKGVPREKLTKEEVKLLQKYGLIENKH